MFLRYSHRSEVKEKAEWLVQQPGQEIRWHLSPESEGKAGAAPRRGHWPYSLSRLAGPSHGPHLSFGTETAQTHCPSR